MSDIKIIDPHRCDKCGKLYGKTNATYQGAELWQSCDCMPENTAFMINTQNFKFVPVNHLSEPEYLHKVGNG